MNLQILGEEWIYVLRVFWNTVYNIWGVLSSSPAPTIVDVYNIVFELTKMYKSFFGVPSKPEGKLESRNDYLSKWCVAPKLAVGNKFLKI